MKLITLCKNPWIMRYKIPMSDHTCRQTYYYYREIIKNIKSNPNLINVELERITNLYPTAIQNGIVEYIVEVDDVHNETIYLSWKGEDYFLDAIPNSISMFFGKDVMTEECFHNHYEFLGF